MSDLAYLKCNPAEKAMLKLLNKKRVIKSCWNKNLLIFVRIGTLFANIIKNPEIASYNIKIKNMTLIFDKNELWYLMAWTLIGTADSLVKSTLKPLRYFQSRSGLKYKFTY